jgi:hypothetical protein
MICRKRQNLAFWQSFAFSRQSFAFFIDASSCALPPRPLSFSTTGILWAISTPAGLTPIWSAGGVPSERNGHHTKSG